jgi:hypothetical protein
LTIEFFPVQVVTWVCDPVHGNTESVNGFKTRRYENVRAEVEAFFDVHDQMGSVPGGVHLEMTGATRGGGDDCASGGKRACGHGGLVEEGGEQGQWLARKMRCVGGEGAGAPALACRLKGRILLSLIAFSSVCVVVVVVVVLQVKT